MSVYEVLMIYDESQIDGPSIIVFVGVGTWMLLTAFI